MDQDKNVENSGLVLFLTQYKNPIISLTDSNPAQSLKSSVLQEDTHFPKEQLTLLFFKIIHHSCYL